MILNKTINVTVRAKIATTTNDTEYICGNSDFIIVFELDPEWNKFNMKTARFVYNGKHQDIVFTGNECPVPVISNTHNIRVGLFAGDLHTTTPAYIPAKKSILCDSGSPEAPSKDVYAQIMELIQGLNDPEEIAKAVAEYMANNPVTVTETDPTVPAWAKNPEKPSYTASEVGALPNTTKIPGKTSDLTNDSGFITGYTETDPTVPSWAKASAKPTYSKSEVGLGNVDNVKQYSASNPPPYPVSSVNGKTGAVNLGAADVGARPETWMPTASEVGALPSGTKIPSKTSELTNDSGFITDYTETDPTVPSWAKAATKPSYTKSEVGLGSVDNVRQYSANNPPPYPVASVNGKTGAVVLDAAAVGARPSDWMPSASDVGALPSGTKIPAKTSDLTNDSGYITKAVSDLTNYYKKSETLSAAEINTKISAIPKFTIEVVNTLPTSGISVTTVYLRLSGSESQNLYTEFIYVVQGTVPEEYIGDDGLYLDGAGIWEKLGTQTVDLTGYATEDFVKGYAQPKDDYALRSEIPAVPVKSVNGKTGAVSLSASDVGARPSTWTPTASEVGALPSSTKIPAKTSELTNDSGFITGYTETDPTVPAWAKASTKPSYTKSEVGLGNVENVKQYSANNPPPYPVTSVNGKTGAVSLSASDVGARPSDWTPTAANVGAVPTSRKINGKALSADITLSASDVGAVPTSNVITVTGVDGDGVTHTWTMYGVKQ